ncbi:MAG: hypothetical protein LC799_26705 [Actinobacteria bacterium]|nr:hypothetical protein [Actinomycetota bacterium]
MIDLDPLWRLLIALSAFGVIPLLMAVGWAVRAVRDSYTAVLIRSWWRGQRHRKRHRRSRHRHSRHSHRSTPAGSGRCPDAPGPAGHHPRRNS